SGAGAASRRVIGPGWATTKRTWPQGAVGSPGSKSARDDSPSAQSTLALIASNPVTSLASSASLPPPRRAPTSIVHGRPFSTRTCTYDGPLSIPTARLVALASRNNSRSPLGGRLGG